MRISHTLCALMFGALAVPVAAQEAKQPTETIIALTVDARGEPKPALKYLLLPELKELKPGNAVPGYMKCFMEQNNFFYNKQSEEDREKYATMPLKDLPDLRKYGGIALRQADYAARHEACDWQTLDGLRTHGIGLLIPEVQQMRRLSGALRVRYRGEIKARAFDDAVVTHKTLFGLSRHLTEHPTLISCLVGVAIGTHALSSFEEMLQQPGCPNFFWAFAELPSPFIDLRKGMHGERIMIEAEFGDFLKGDEPVSQATIDKFMVKFKGLEGFLVQPTNKIDAGNWINARSKNEKVVKAARKRLTEEAGYKAATLDKWPPAQVVIRDELYQYEVFRDDLMKWINLPYYRAEAGLLGGHAKSLAMLEKATNDDPDASLLVSWEVALAKISRAQYRLQQRLAMLQHVEAIRIYAAANGGKLPATLDAIPLPLPIDPFTGKAFRYEVRDGKAILRGTPPKGEEKTASYNVQYEITLRK